MKKSSFVAMVLGTVSGVLFALGMCMALIPEWDMLGQGAAVGAAGLVIGAVTVLVWRRMEHKRPIHVSAKAVVTAAAGVVGAMGLGVGMCCSMIWDMMAVGVAIGLTGIVVLLSIIPLTRGVRG